MADVPSQIQPPPPGSFDLMGLLITKVFPAFAGAYIRNLFPPRKPLLQRAAEAFGGVVLVIYAGPVAGGALWGLLGWLMTSIGVDDITPLINREQSDLLAAFLVGLLGMTVVEGALVFIRAWWRGKAAT